MTKRKRNARLSVHTDFVHASDDAPHDENHDASAGHSAEMLSLLKAEERFSKSLVKTCNKSRARSAALRYEHLIEEHYADDPTFFEWDENRALDRQSFDYLFYHREHFKPQVQTCLEIIASKIMHVTADGEDGYFNKLEKNIGWVAHITPILFAMFPEMEKLVRCGLWSNAENSRRCHKPDLCPLCLWNDHLKVLVHAFGTRSGAFNRAEAWWFLTLGFSSNRNNAKWVVQDFDPVAPEAVDGDRAYEPYPVQLGPNRHDQSDPWVGYEDARFLGLIVQEALDELYQSRNVDGYRNKLEGAFLLQPGAETRMNMHGHAVANGSETNAEFIAEQLYNLMAQGLRKYRHQLWHEYYPDVKVCPLSSAQDLEGCVVYSEKIVPIARIVAEAMAKPGARAEDGSWNPAYVFGLERALFELLNEDIPAVFTKFRYDQELLYLRRRKTVGNMTFTDSGTCIGNEPRWHKKIRRERARKQKEKRAERRRREVEAQRNVVVVTPHKPQKRSRKNPRRRKRSLASTTSRKRRSQRAGTENE